MIRASFLLLAIASSSCSSSTNDAAPATVTQMIGPDGGSIVVGGATMTFPKGAVATATAITITEGGTVPAGFVALSSVFKCEPSGTNFAQPVMMQMLFTADGKVSPKIFWSSGGDPTFKELETTVPGTGVATAPVLHFSSGFVGYRQ